MIAAVQRTLRPKLKPTAITNVKVFCISDPPRGDTHIKGTGELVGNFEKNLVEVPILT